ncbi:hypothetical protein ANCDUO_20136 [Ancylostoma duodenale]|uniref:Uncharacterized protein n=1 Tax=Ancylostoma duodenale TaxID=51022 RepID=A0A0C2C0M8_9BILA|nr:hypothetical protein ANCDUO_20136 [Ancylostoma duodenale]
MDEARALRLHKQRLEHRSRILEQQNEQLELQLQRLKGIEQSCRVLLRPEAFHLCSPRWEIRGSNQGSGIPYRGLDLLNSPPRLCLSVTR